jgi:hypothetical protein
MTFMSFLISAVATHMRVVLHTPQEIAVCLCARQGVTQALTAA